METIMAERSGWATPDPDDQGWRRSGGIAPDAAAHGAGGTHDTAAPDTAEPAAGGTDADADTRVSDPAGPVADARWARPDTAVAAPTGGSTARPDPEGRWSPDPGGQPVSWGRPTFDEPAPPTDRDWARPGGGTPPERGESPAGGQGRWGVGRAAQRPPGWSPPNGGFFRAPKPGIIPLRPLGLSEILDGTFANARQNPGATFGLAAIVMTAIGLVNLVLDLAGRDASTGMRTLLAVGSFAITWSAQSVVAGMLSVIISEAVLGGKITLGGAYERLHNRLRGLVLLGFAVLGLTALGLLALVLAAVGLTAVGLLVFLAWAVYVAVLCGVSGPAYALEGGRVRDALRRSRSLITGAWWRTFGIILLIGIVAILLSTILMIPFSLISAGGGGTVFVGTSSHMSTTALFVNAVGSIVSYTITIPIVSGGIALIYVDRRMRVEGLEVTLAQAARDRAGA
jgi:hypothetical protein